MFIITYEYITVVTDEKSVFKDGNRYSSNNYQYLFLLSIACVDHGLLKYVFSTLDPFAFERFYNTYPAVVSNSLE